MEILSLDWNYRLNFYNLYTEYDPRPSINIFLLKLQAHMHLCTLKLVMTDEIIVVKYFNVNYEKYS